MQDCVKKNIQISFNDESIAYQQSSKLLISVKRINKGRVKLQMTKATKLMEGGEIFDVKEWKVIE